MTSALTNHVWQSTWFALLLALLTLAFRHNRAQVRYGLWFCASCKFLIPFSLLMRLGSHLRWVPVAKNVATPALSFTVEQISQPFPNPWRATSSAITLHTDWVPVLLVTVWISGAGAIALMRLREWHRIRALVHASSPLSIAAPVEVRSSQSLLEPGVVGLFRPVLILPEGLREHLTPLQFEAVLVHEFCHVQRRDNLTSALHMIVEAVFWFHPLVWWMGSQLLQERERACDEAVLSRGTEPRLYAEAILSICRSFTESPLLCVSGVTGSHLKQRMENIMVNYIGQRLNRPKKLLLASLGVTAVGAPIALGLFLSVGGAPSIHAQSSTGPAPKFQTAAIRPCAVVGSMENRAGSSSSGRLSTGCNLLVDANHFGLIQRAYVQFAGGRRNPIQIVPVEAGPEWVRSQGFQIEATAEGQPMAEMMAGPMLQALLEDRFQLRIHRETREGPVYSLTVAKGGSKLKLFAEGNCLRVSSLPAAAPPLGQRYCDDLISARNPASIHEEAITVSEFCQFLNLVLDRPVIDNTGLSGKYMFHVSFARDQSTSRLPPLLGTSAGAGEPAGPGIFAALQEQLGLTLVPAQGSTEVLVIDNVERPSAN